MQTLFIINPKSGSLRDLSEVASTIRHHPSTERPEIRITGETDDAGLLARAGVEHGFRRIFAVGGDGTLNEVINGVMGDGAEAEAPADLVLGLLPMGTGNDFARSLGLPLDVARALDLLPECVPREVDVARVEGGVERWFANASAGGFSGEVDEGLTASMKRSWGPLAYLRSALNVLPDPPTFKAVLETDAAERLELDVLNIVVANGRSVAGGIPIAPDARLDDGRLDVVVVRAAPLSQLAGFGSRCLVGKHVGHELVEHFTATRIDVRSEPAMIFNFDGELLGETPLAYSVRPRGLRILAPVRL